VPAVSARSTLVPLPRRRAPNWSRSPTPPPRPQGPSRKRPALPCATIDHHHERAGHRWCPDHHADRHARQLDRAGREGRQGGIFCEKPIDLDAARVRACLKVVADSGARLMVGSTAASTPISWRPAVASTAGLIGDVEMVSIVSRDPGPPGLDYLKRSGGLFRDMTIHDFDMARFLLGEEPPRSTLCVGTGRRGREVDRRLPTAPPSC